jgi:hypothetical protein
MTSLGGVVQMLKKEHDRLAKQIQGISTALSAFGAAREADKNETQPVGGRAGENRGCSEATMGQSERKRLGKTKCS